MKKAIILFVAVFLALLLCSEVHTASIQKSFISADAKWIVQFDMKRLTSTRLHQLLINDESTAKIRKKMEKLVKKYKFDPLKDIVSITAYGTGKKEENTVVCVEGKFDKDHLLGLIAKEEDHVEISYGKYTIYKWGHDDFGVFVNNNLVLFSGNDKMIKNALDVIDGKKNNLSSSPMMKYINEIPKDAFLMAVVDNISSLAGKHDKALMLQKTGMASFAITEKKEDMDVGLKFTTESSEDAQNVEQMIKGVIAFANLQLKKEKDLLALLERLHISIDGNRVQIGFTYPVEKLFDVITGRAKLLPCFLMGKL
ncbi:MAG: hypothetical protein JSV96_14695 [Candidatus Aminicenantes bacterium]|nr:MAG: hypothetical protein JSV96_14695 [Candidatus Aminicenantes bacterium]